MRNRVLLLVISLLTILLVGCGASDETNQAGEGLPVTVAKATQGKLQGTIGITGKIEAVQSANVVCKVPGKVASISVDIGSTVTAGQLLLSLDARDLAAAVTQAEASVAAAQAQVETARAAIETAQVTYDAAKKNYDRGLELVKAQAISQYEFDNNYEKPYKLAQTGLASAKAALNSAQSQVTVAQAGLQKAQVAYNESLVTAPISGVVTARNVNPGEMATTTSPVVTIVNLDKVVVKASVNEEQVNKLKTGEKVMVRVAAVSEKPLEGKVTNISLAADPQTKAYTVKVQLDNPQHLLKPGMFAEVMVNDSQDQGLIVPRQAVIPEKENHFVFVVENGVAKKRMVEVKLADDKNVLISSGLKEGEEVVSSGQASLKEGQKVYVKGK